MKQYSIIAGVNGVGKSSLMGVLRAERADLGVIINTDMLIAKAQGDLIAGGKQAVRMIADCLEREISFTQETTLSGHRILQTVKAAREKGYSVRLYYVGLDTAEESLARIEARVRRGGHAVSERDVRRRFLKRFDDLWRILPYCEEAVFYDNENGFAEVAVYQNGQILQVGSWQPNWLGELLRKGTKEIL